MCAFRALAVPQRFRVSMALDLKFKFNWEVIAGTLSVSSVDLVS